ncbi:hypothetical protein ACU686_08765 [Yinghuangia aomiensis]
MHEMRLDAGDDARPRAWHITEPGEHTALCGTAIVPVGGPPPADGCLGDDLHCGDCFAAYRELITAEPAGTNN